MKVIIGTALACLAVVFLLRYEPAAPHEEQSKLSGTLATLALQVANMVEDSEKRTNETSGPDSYCNNNAVIEPWRFTARRTRGGEEVSFGEVTAAIPSEFRSLINSVDSLPTISSEGTILETVPFEPSRVFRLREFVDLNWELGEGLSKINLTISSYKGCISRIWIVPYATIDLYTRDTDLPDEP